MTTQPKLSRRSKAAEGCSAADARGARSVCPLSLANASYHMARVTGYVQGFVQE